MKNYSEEYPFRIDMSLTAAEDLELENCLGLFAHSVGGV